MDLLDKLQSYRIDEEAYATVYFQILSKWPSCINMLKMPAAYALVEANKQHIPLAPPFQPTQGGWPCPFCKASNCPGHTPKECPIRLEYVWQGKVIINEQGFYRWPNDSRILNDPWGIKFVVDQAQASRVQGASVAFLQVDPVDGMDVLEGVEEDVREEDDIQETRGAYPAIVMVDNTPATTQGSANMDRKPPQYTYKSKCDDANAVQRVFDHVMAARVDVSLAELMALSLDFRKYTVDFCKVNRTVAYSLSPELPSSLTTTGLLATSAPVYSSPIMELPVKVTDQFNEVGLYDSGVELVCIRKEAVKELNLPWNSDLKLNMCDANGGTRTNTSVVENLELTIAGISIFVHAWIINKAPYHLLLGWPFQMAAQCNTEDVGETLIVFDPKKPV